MHSSTQVLAQRALPAARTKPRWQPYNSIPSASTLRSPNMNTPNPPVSPRPAQAAPPHINNISRSATSTINVPTPKDPSLRDPSKHKFAAGLIDRTVATLSEIWRPQDIPIAFQPPKGTSNDIIPSSHQPASSKSPLPSTSTSLEPTSSSTFPSTSDQDQNLLPMKSFVHEVLRRSRTSGNILQAALCYLEAVRPKVPEILRQERMGIRAHYLPDSTILPATPAELEREVELTAMDQNMDCRDDLLKTVCVTDMDTPDLDHSIQSGSGDEISISSLLAEPSLSSAPTPTPALPSPLLCPRRTFLASLILASKFFQDKCYSNRAWAKLSGLPPREIGRCERALGQALEWRLWVGKSPATSQSTLATPSSPRMVVRSQSESCLFTSSLSTQPFLVQEDSQPSKAKEASPSRGKQGSACHLRSGLRRSSTVPNDVFSTQTAGLCETSASTCQVNEQDQGIASSSKNVIQCEVEGFASSSSTVEHALSPRPSTPALSYSPSSTESSIGENTVQMAAFEDNIFPSYDGTQLWLDGRNSHSAIKTASPISLDSTYTYVDGELILGLVGVPVTANAVSIVDPSGGPYRRYIWQDNRHCRSVEAAGVH